MGTLDWLSDNLIELRGPVDLSQDAAFNEAATVTAKLYDTALDCRVAKFVTTLTADYASESSRIFVLDVVPFSVDGDMLVVMDGGGESRKTITAVNTSTGEISFSGSLVGNATEGNVVTVVSYGTGIMVVPLDNFQGWEDGMNLEITLDDGTLTERTVSLINPNAGYLTLSSTLGGSASVSNLIKRKVGPSSITLTSFGTFPTSNPEVGDPAWGFRGTIDHNAADLAPGMRVRGEITALDGALNLTRKAIATVINK
jgi:hypothetical protein